MAYPFFPQGYNPYPQMFQTPQTQQSNLIHVQSENQAREWSVSLGSSVMFIDDNSPYIYTKTAGMSQLEPAVFKRFKIIEDCASQRTQDAPEQLADNSQGKLSEYLSKAEFEPFKALLDEIQKKLEKLKELTDDEQSA